MRSMTHSGPADEAPEAAEPPAAEANGPGTSTMPREATTAEARAKKADPRAARLAAALKANIGRRKSAARAAARDDEA